VYVYSPSGTLLGSWSASGLTTPTDLATDGTDIWVLDQGAGRVYRYAAAAARRSGSQASADSFALDAANTAASGLALRGTTFWVTNEGSGTNKVYLYSLSGAALGNWTLDSANDAPSGVTVNLAGGADVWVSDRTDGKVYRYGGGTGWTSGSHS